MSTGQHACPLASCPVLRHSLDQLLTREWLLTDGLGGFASSTVIGCPTRRYHGLLVAAKRPPIERYNLLPGVLDRITVADQTVELSTFEFPDVLHPTGYTLLSDFEWETGTPDPWVEFTFTHDLFEARKRITLCTGQRAVRLNYQIAPRVPGTVRLEVSPLVALRDFHSLRHREMTDPWDLANETDAVWIHPQRQHEVTLALVTTSGEFRWQPDPVWWRNFRYRLERQRGFDQDEDLLNVGTFRAEAAGALSCGLAAVGFVGSTAVARELIAGPRPRTVHPVPHGAGSDPVVKRLLAAGDQFIVRRESPDAQPARTTILAGYPWFGDWGRDSFIALEGLLLIPGRYAEARQVLETFAGAQRDGLIPNRFDDYGHDCAYNSVDASLWFIHAADAYLTASGDVAAWDAFLLEACRGVVRSFCAGTEFDIRVDARGLVCCGNEQTQITWMDAKCDEVVFTPRHGRPVEVNALWYHALHIVAARAEDSDPELAQSCRTVIEQVQGSFTEVFWNHDADCLFDCVRDDESDAANTAIDLSVPEIVSCSLGLAKDGLLNAAMAAPANSA
ncbi:MAG: glycogen debranching enzyme N-terminal domain-containing protein [Planctomycetes bacterium]|nr:glycogen debranching enzyme N-terminal domain-containing protein [Planctomycetota bacterium]